ncbi:MAG: HypC/HybG/HupF family hydrogenase formation chaperone [Candidatus Njordarchaeales archaeon]
MCLGVPAKVLKVDDHKALVDYGGGIKKIVDAFLVPDIKPGDYVIVHAGAIISKISEEDYREMIELLSQILASMESEEG